MLGRAGELRLTGPARDRLELLSDASLNAATEDQRVRAEWRDGRLRLRILDPQYRSPGDVHREDARGRKWLAQDRRIDNVDAIRLDHRMVHPDGCHRCRRSGFR
jgi:hypothetical protein